MAFARAASVALVGVQGHLVEVEAHLAQGLPGLVITGLPDTAVAEARDRVRAAVLNSGESWPARRMTVGLGPAWLPKHGSGFDLAVAVALLMAAEAVPAGGLAGAALLGELGLDGRVRPVRGVLPATVAAAKEGVRRMVVAAANAEEARLVPGVAVIGVTSLRCLLAFLRGDPPPAEAAPAAAAPAAAAVLPGDDPPDLADVVGQDLGRLAVEVAAAGGHHLALFGPPGAGKTMLAERLPGLLPPLEIDAALEVTAIHSVAGTLPAGCPLIRRPPYQAPHHTASIAALVGGGSGLAKPGAISLASRGVLFLDEAPEFQSRVLDSLRQPLEKGEVVIARSGGVARYPAAVQLVLAANPCPCATAAGDTACTCSGGVRRRYLGRLSGPLLDRIDIQVDLLPVRGSALLADPELTEPTAVVAERVARARAAAAERWRPHGWRTNSVVPGGALRGRYRLPRSATAALDAEVDQGLLSARGYVRVHRMAWTIADLAGRSTPCADDIHEAMYLRMRGAA
jgi:magnesium chelatase family protein